LQAAFTKIHQLQNANFTMTEDPTMNVNPEVMSLWRSTFLRRNSGGSLFDLAYANNVPLSNPPADHRFIKANRENLFTRGTLVPETVSSFHIMPPTSAKVIASSKEHPVNLTLEEIFRDHDLQESSNTLENSMDNIEECNSVLSGIFDDEDQQAPLTSLPGTRPTSMQSSGCSVDTADTPDPADDGTQRFKPFHEEKWNTRLKELLQYREERGDCLVPHTFNPNPQLARWVKRQRRQYKLTLEGRASTMSQERLAILNEIGFVWDSHEAAWQEKLNELYQYCKERGNCLVPSNYKVNPQLATWVKCQRRQYKLYWIGRPSAMTPERIIRLEKMGFEWEIRSSGQAGMARSDYLYLSEAISKMA